MEIEKKNSVFENVVQVLLSEGNKFRLELVTQGSGSSVQLECS